MASNSHIWLRNRRDFWLLRGIAAIISVLLWITVLKGKKVEITKKVTLDYQLPKDMTIANQVPREVSFRVSGPRAFVRDFEEQPMTLPIDLSSARVGDYEHFLAQDDLDVPFGLKVLSISQSTIPIKIDRLALKRVPVRGVFAGQLTDGMRVVGITFKPSTVDLHGSAQKLQTLENVPTEAIALSPSALKQEFDVKLALGELPGVMVDEPSRVVHVTVELEGSVSRKWLKNIEVGLKVRGGGGLRAVQDAAGLGIRLKPATVSFLMEGPDRIVSKLKSTDIEVWAEVPELRKGNVRARLDWRLSPELRVVRRSSDWVDVVIPPLQ